MQERVNFSNTQLEHQICDLGKSKLLTDVTGLSIILRGGKRGTTIFFKAIQTINGKKHIKLLGKYPQCTIEQARALYTALIAQQRQGVDVFTPRPVEETVVVTVGDIWEEWRHNADLSISENTQKKYKSIYSTHISKIKGHSTEWLTSTNVMKFLQPYIDEGKIATARRIADVLRELLDYTTFKGLTPFNPLNKISKFLPKIKIKHHATFSDETLEQDMTALFAAMKDEPVYLQNILHFYFYTLLRNSEVRLMRIRDIQGDYVDVKTKTLENFRVPLVRQAQEIIRYQIDHHESIYNDYLFTSPLNTKMSDATLLKAIKKVGFKDKLAVHGIRSCGRQWLTAQPHIKESIIELCLSHVVGNMTEQAYNRGEYLEQRREVMQKWADFVEKCIGNNKVY